MLASELTRHRTRLAAEARDQDLMDFLFKQQGAEDTSYLGDIKERLRYVWKNLVVCACAE